MKMFKKKMQGQGET